MSITIDKITNFKLQLKAKLLKETIKPKQTRNKSFKPEAKIVIMQIESNEIICNL